MFLRKKNIKILILFLFFLSLFLFFLFLLNSKIYVPIKTIESDIVLEINKGANSEQIFQILKKHKILNSRIKYNYLILLKGDSYIPKYGQYLIPKYSSLNSVLEIINSGISIKHKITIPEGLTTKKLLEIISADNNLKGHIHQKYKEIEGELLP